MHRLKSLFITLYVLASLAIGGYGLLQYRHDGALGWLGTVLTTVPGLLLILTFYLTRSLARTTPRLPVLVALGGLGVGLAGYAVVAAPGPLARADAAEAFAASLLGFALFLTYDLWYSRFERTPQPALAVGQPLPAFTAVDLDGQPVAAAHFRGQPTFFLFYRGNWCPLCMAQIKEVAAGYRALAERGVAVVLISPQPPGHTRRLARRFSVPFHFLVDPGGAAARTLGIEAVSGLPAGYEVLGYDRDTVLPTALLTDADGCILWVDETDNYRVRPAPETFLGVLDARRS